MRKAVIAVVTSVVAGVLVWWLTSIFTGPSQPTPSSPPVAEPEPRVSCEGTLVAREEVSCTLDIRGPGLFSATLTPSKPARSWRVGLRGLIPLGTCTAESPGLEEFGASFISASGTLTIECPVSSSAELSGHEIVFEDGTGITNFSLAVEAGFR